MSMTLITNCCGCATPLVVKVDDEHQAQEIVTKLYCIRCVIGRHHGLDPTRHKESFKTPLQ